MKQDKDLRDKFVIFEETDNAINNAYPDYLYHYTSIDTLKLILSNRTIKFNCLCNMDDADECMQGDASWGLYCFVSCWTDEEKESIEMWKMYSNDLKGVRIKLKRNPFIDYDEFLMLSKPYYALYPKTTDKLLNKITYEQLETLDLLKKEDIYVDKNDMFIFYPDKLGVLKNDYWKFQKEWRYRLFLIPDTIMTLAKANMMKISKTVHLPIPPFDSVFLRISPDAFNDMEILLGPEVSEYEKFSLYNFVKKEKLNIKITDSKLKYRVIGDIESFELNSPFLIIYCDKRNENMNYRFFQSEKELRKFASEVKDSGMEVALALEIKKCRQIDDIIDFGRMSRILDFKY